MNNTFFVVFPQVLETSMNFNVSKMVYYIVKEYMRIRD